MKTKNYTQEDVLQALKQKRCKVTYNGLTYILDVSTAENLGNKSWGKIGYLVGYHDVRLIGKLAYMHKHDDKKEEQGFKMKDPLITNNKLIINPLLK
jgi:hypothetical protein